MSDRLIFLRQQSVDIEEARGELDTRFRDLQASADDIMFALAFCDWLAGRLNLLDAYTEQIEGKRYIEKYGPCRSRSCNVGHKKSLQPGLVIEGHVEQVG